MTTPAPRRIGVISDTHDLLRPEAMAALAGCDLVLHAGDVCGPEVLAELRTVAPVIAVRGNNDRGAWGNTLPETTTLTIGDVLVLMVHDVQTLPPAALGQARIVVHGHSHQPRKETRGGVLYFNPGSAGPRRFQLPISLGHLEVTGDRVHARLVDLVPRGRHGG